MIWIAPSEKDTDNAAPEKTESAKFEQARALDSPIQNLRRTRDLLLPRLVSGQVKFEMN